MRRIGWWMWTAAWCVTAGIAVNVVVTWGIAVWMPVGGWDLWPCDYVSYAKARGDRSAQYRGPDGVMGYWERASGTGIDIYHAHGLRGDAAVPAIYEGGWYDLVEDVGWPMHGMRSHVMTYYDEHGNLPTRWDLPGRVVVDRGLQTDDLPAWMHAQAGRRVPLRPHGWGFVADSVLWAVLIGGLYAIARLLNGKPEE